MGARLTRGLTLLGLLLVLGAVNYSIVAKERIMRSGEVILLELAPVDPRSLMQGDYMALRFRLADELQGLRTRTARERFRGSRTAPLVIDDRRVATLAETDTDAGLRIRYRLRNGEIWLGTNAYFFEEGMAQRYQAARYGEFRLDRDSGEAVLVGMRDEYLERL